MSLTFIPLELHEKRGEVHQRDADDHAAEIDPVDERKPDFSAVARDQLATSQTTCRIAPTPMARKIVASTGSKAKPPI